MTYMIITKDKARTHPIITTIPNVANLLRESARLSPRAHSIAGRGTGHRHHLHSIHLWKQRPGYSILRTLILTSPMCGVWREWM
jgi:hypothetical protein